MNRVENAAGLFCLGSHAGVTLLRQFHLPATRGLCGCYYGPAMDEPEEEAIPLEDFGELETRYLLRSPANRERLLRAVENVGRGEELVIVDPDDFLGDECPPLHELSRGATQPERWLPYNPLETGA